MKNFSAKAILLYLIITPLIIFAQKSLQYKAEYITIENGLSQNTASVIFQDSRGFMWFGTFDGLCRWDGYSFKVYKNIPNDTTSISSNTVTAIAEDKYQNLWFATPDGLNKYNFKSEKFVTYRHSPAKKNSLSADRIYSLGITGDLLYIGTLGGGLNILNVKTGKFGIFKKDPNKKNSINNDYILCIFKASSGKMWIGTSDGLCSFEYNQKSFEQYKYNPNNSGSIPSYVVTSICEDKNKNLWLSFFGGGIAKFNPARKQFTKFKFDKNNNQLSNENVNNIFIDSDQNLWIGTQKGLNVLNTLKNELNRFENNSGFDDNSLRNDDIQYIAKDRTGIIFIGTRINGITVLKKSLKKFEHYTHSTKSANSLLNNGVFSFALDSSQNIWIGTLEGLNKFNPKTKTFTAFKAGNSGSQISNDNIWYLMADPDKKTLWVGTGTGLDLFDINSGRVIKKYAADYNNSNKLSNASIYCLTYDITGEIWVGTDFGLNKINTKTGKIKRYFHNPKNQYSLPADRIWVTFKDSKNNIWVGTSNGLAKYNRNNDNFIIYKNKPRDPKSIGYNEINSIFEDSKKQLWIGTVNGLNRYDYSADSFINYNRINQFLKGTIYSPLEDDKNNLWFGTNNGLIKFNTSDLQVSRFDVSDGIQSLEFNFPALKTNDGKFYFGGINGFNSFYPDSIQSNTHIPPVFITKLSLLNKEINVGRLEDGRNILNQSIIHSKEIVLSYKDYSVSFDFAALDYYNPQKNNFAYIMENLDEKWNYVNDRNFASYNLPPGEYVLKVRAANNDGLWNYSGTSLRITVIPPFYETFLFKVIIFLLISGSGFALYRYRTLNIKKRNELLEENNKKLNREIASRQNAEKEKERLNHILKEKNQDLEQIIYVTSHDFRTPLVNIQGFSTELNFSISELINKIENLEIPDKNRIEMHDLIYNQIPESIDFIQKNISRMDKLLNGLLNYSRKGRETLTFSKIDTNKLMKDLVPSFEYLLVQKEIKLFVDDLPDCYGDELMISQVFANLIINAIQYYDETKKSYIKIFGEIKDDSVVFSIEDNGIGIDKSYHKKIFDIFYRLHPEKAEGEGLGLTIVSKILRGHSGKIDIESIPGVGSRFMFSLPKYPEQENQ